MRMVSLDVGGREIDTERQRLSNRWAGGVRTSTVINIPPSLYVQHYLEDTPLFPQRVSRENFGVP